MSEVRAGDFLLTLPLAWRHRALDGRTFLICDEPPGVVCCTPERVLDTKTLPNLSRMLAGYLTRTGRPVATDELLRMTGSVGLDGFSWQFTERATFYRFWLYGNEQAWILLTFNTPQEHCERFQKTLGDTVRSLRYAPVAAPDQGG